MRELAGLPGVPAAAIAAVTIADAAALTTGELGEVLRRAVLAHDPEAARKRRERAQKDARVESWAESRGTAALAGRDLPPAAVLAADQHIDGLARQLKAAGAPGTLEQLRARVFLALLTSQPLYTLLPGHDTHDGGAPGNGGTAGNTWPAGPGRAPGLAGSVNLTIPLTSWLGLTARPGEAAGHGPLDADTSRDLAALLAGRPASRWCVTITGSCGRAIGHGCARAGPGPPGPGSDPHTWLAGVKIRWLETGACGHARETFTYQPSPILRRLVKTRNRTCCFPGCRRAARRCDDDHTVPYDQGGRTCECNLAPLCRRHHAAKQAPGWHLRQPQPGHLSWALPTGRTRTVGPRPYST